MNTIKISEANLLHVLTDGVVAQLQRLTEREVGISISKYIAGGIEIHVDGESVVCVLVKADGTVASHSCKDQAWTDWANNTLALLG